MGPKIGAGVGGQPNNIFFGLSYTCTDLGGYSVQKILRGHATNMGSKISLFIIRHRIWYMNGSIFQNFQKFEPKLAYIYENFGKIGRFCSNLTQKWDNWYMNGSLFLEKMVFVRAYFQNLWRHVPTKTKLEYPTPRVQT